MFRVIIAMGCSVILFFSSYVFAGYGAKICSTTPNLYCHVVKKGETWDRLFPDETQRDLAMRVNRMNTKLYPGLKIALPNSETLTTSDLAPFPLAIDPPGRKIITISLSKLAFGAYDPQGNLLYWGPISAAKGYCPDVRRGCHTPSGKFAIYSKKGSGCVSSKYPVGKGGAPMPYCMFFRGGYALHGSYTVPGYHDSHGCVRLFVKDAKWLNQEFTLGESGVPVIVRK